MSGADFRGATLTDTELDGALLHGAKFNDVTTLIQEQINKALGDRRTELPPNLVRPAAWGG